ncbi:MAG: DUF3575 domain-containing protein [Flavobacteriaceae bacterium]|nr:DUF3575 domain-containing protein [Flavobacteriaceae bacterium]
MRKIKNSIFIIFYLLTITQSFSQDKYSIRIDFTKVFFGAYQIGGEYNLNENISLGLEFIDFKASRTLTSKTDAESRDKVLAVSPFIRYYRKNNHSSTSFYQGSFRYLNYVGLGDQYDTWRNLLSIDIVYGYQFKISNIFYIEPSIGLGVYKKLNADKKTAISPYPILNFNLTIRP